MEETLKLDNRGRIVIPKRIRKKLGLIGGSEVRVYLDKSKIVIEPIVKVKKVRANALDEAFFDAGMATFGE